MQRQRRSDPTTRAKDRARKLARYALAHGKISRKPCEACGEQHAEMHHPNYTAPLDVVWLCTVCHTKVHVQYESKRAGEAFAGRAPAYRHPHGGVSAMPGKIGDALPRMPAPAAQPTAKPMSKVDRLRQMRERASA